MSRALRIGKIYIDKKNVLYFSALGLYLVFAILSASFYLKYFIGTLYTIVLSLCLVLLVLHRLTQGKFNIRQLFWILVAFLSFWTVYQISGLSVAILLIFIFFSTGVKFDDIAEFAEIIELLVLIFIVTSSKVGIIENYIYNVGGRYRE